MKRAILILVFLIGFISCKKEVVQKVNNLSTTKISSIKTYNFSELKPFLEKSDDNIYIINFWATWCAPCVKELPYFEKIKQEYADKNVVVLLVSLDFPKQVDKKLIPFINKNKIQSEVVLLDDINEDVWIKAIDDNWSGAIPATLIYNKRNRKFYEQSFDYDTLESELLTFINK
jgi:thiol-disulfide isomerase/thioredoxin